MSEARFEVLPVGTVESPLTDRAAAPLQGHEGSPEAWLVFEPWVRQGLDELFHDPAPWIERSRGAGSPRSGGVRGSATVPLLTAAPGIHDPARPRHAAAEQLI
jgi:hypothetical protein